MVLCRIVEFLDIAPDEGSDQDRDDSEQWFDSVDALLDHIKQAQLGFASQLADLRFARPKHELNHLGPEYVGVGCVFRILNESNQELSVGTAPHHWTFVTEQWHELPQSGSTPKGTIFFFGDWTALPSSQTYAPEKAKQLLRSWLAHGTVAERHR